MAYGEAPTTVGWRKDKDRDTGEDKGWKLFGPTTLLQVGPVMVTKRDGTVSQVFVGRVSRAFVVDGVECCYGWPATADEAQAAYVPAPQEQPQSDPWAGAQTDWFLPSIEV